MKIFLTRRYSFAASHRLCRPDWSDAENYRIFGKCANPYGHGHNYLLEVTVAGAVDPQTGMIMNLTDLDAIVKTNVLDAFDHVYLNEQVPEFRDIVPTTENLCRVIFQRLSGATTARLERIRIEETGRNSFECDAAGGSAHQDELHAAYQEQMK